MFSPQPPRTALRLPGKQVTMHVLSKPRPSRPAAMGKEKGAVAVKNVVSGFVREAVTAGPKLNLCCQFDAPSDGTSRVIGLAQIPERAIPLVAFALPKTEFGAL